MVRQHRAKRAEFCKAQPPAYLSLEQTWHFKAIIAKLNMVRRDPRFRGSDKNLAFNAAATILSTLS
jgi:hypothetical protein